MIFYKTKSIYFGLLICISFISCEKKKEIPKNIVAKEKMVIILADAYQLEASLASLKLKEDNVGLLFNDKYLPELLDKHQVSKERYDSSYSWYLVDFNRALDLMKVVKDTLQQRKIKKHLYLPEIDSTAIKK